jgi:hypothetical protein
LRRLMAFLGRLPELLGRLLSWLLTVGFAMYLLRIPLLTVLGFIFLYGFAFFSAAKRILRNGFDVDSFWDLVFVSVAAFLLGWVIVVTARLVMLHGVERFFDADARPDDDYARWIRYLYYALIPLTIIVVVIGALAGATYTSEGLGWLSALGAGLLGLLLFLPLALVVHVVELYFTSPDVFAREPYDVFFPTSSSLDEDAAHEPDEDGAREPADDRLGPIGRANRSIRTQDPANRLIQWRSIAWIVGRLRRLLELVFPKNVGRGYFEYGTDGNIVWIRRGHLGALVLFALTLGLYFAFGEIDFRRLTHGQLPLFPTLCSVLLLATLLCWGFSMAAFFLDRFRIPVFIPLVVLLLATSFAPWLRSDHYYPVEEPVQLKERAVFGRPDHSRCRYRRWHPVGGVDRAGADGTGGGMPEAR